MSNRIYEKHTCHYNNGCNPPLKLLIIRDPQSKKQRFFTSNCGTRGLCDPESKLGVLRWLETVAFPGLDVATVTHDHLLRAMDALIDQQATVDRVVAKLLCPLIDQELAVVFYDLTTLRAEGLSESPRDLRRFGMSKEGVIARQFLLGVVQTAAGLPLYHQVFEGNTGETTTLLPTLQTVLKRYPTIRRLILIADRGLLSLDHLEALSAIRLDHGQPLELILAVPGRRYHEFTGSLVFPGIHKSLIYNNI